MKNIALVMVLIGMWTSMTWIWWLPRWDLGFIYGVIGGVLALAGAWYIDNYVEYINCEKHSSGGSENK